MHNAGTDTDAPGRVTLFLAEYAKFGGTDPGPRTHEALQEAICTIPEGLYPAMMTGARETLAAIKARGMKTGLVSNAGITSAPTLRLMLTHYGLFPHLDALVFSDELKLAKPSAAMFTTAIEALGCSAGEAVFVGDSPAHDIFGAKAVGLKTVQIGGKQVEGIEPDARIETLGELADVLAGLDPRRVSLRRTGA